VSRPFSRAADNSAGCGQIRLAAAPIISGGGGGVSAAPAFRTSLKLSQSIIYLPIPN